MRKAAPGTCPTPPFLPEVNAEPEGAGVTT